MKPIQLYCKDQGYVRFDGREVARDDMISLVGYLNKNRKIIIDEHVVPRVSKFETFDEFMDSDIPGPHTHQFERQIAKAVDPCSAKDLND